MIQSQCKSHKKIKALRDSGARFRATFENAAVGIARVAEDGCWLEVNQRLCDIVGYSREELMTKTFGDITHPDDLESDWNQARRLLAGEIENYSMEKRYYRKDGSIVWVNLTVSLARKADGSPDYFVSVVEDISARKRLEEANQKRVALCADVSAALAEHHAPLQSMLQKSAEALVRHLDAAFARIWTLNPKESLLELQASAGMYTHLNGSHSRVPVGELKIGLIAKERQPHLTNDLVNDPRISNQAWARENGMVAFAGYPLLVEDRVIGVMAMFARHPLTEDTVEAIATVAAPIAQGIERKRAEEALRESEGRFRQLAESLPQLVWTCRADGLCDYLSPQWVAYTGIPEAEQLGSGWLEQLHPDDREPVFMAWNRAVANDTSFDVEYRIRRNDGVYRWFKTRAVTLRDSGGKIIKWFGSNMDIDDQKHAEESLRESKERLAGILSSAMDAIITVDDDHRIVLFNEAAERMFGCLAAQALGRPLNRFIPDRFRAAHTEQLRRFGETGGASRTMGRLLTLTALRSDGAEFPIEATISSIEVGGRKLYTVIYRDITERKRAEAVREELLTREKAARAAAEAASRSKDEFLAMVSHELRTPLNAILGYTRMLRSDRADRTLIDSIPAIVESNVKAQLQIIEDLMDSARIVTGRLRIELGPVDLTQTLEAALDTVRPAADVKGITLVADFDPLPEQTLGDPARLQQVVWNLLSNSVKFTPEGGRVELRMEGAADRIRITVSDTGKGIEPERLPYVFDRFWQADSSSTRRYGGLGLGLSLVKHLVELHGGMITAASEGEGRGATFTLTLPRRQLEFIDPLTPAVAPREVRTEDSLPMDQELSLEDVSVLVVDDQEEARELLTQALGEYGAQVAAVSSGVEALAFLSDPPGGKRPDALILDIAMPDEDGYTVLKKARALEAARGAAEDQIPAIALTAFGRSEDRLRAIKEGFQMHVTKPVEPTELAAVIVSVTTRHAWEREQKE
jgi:PAS domain S-box-containing protein